LYGIEKFTQIRKTMKKIESDSTQNETKRIKTLGLIFFLISLTTGSLDAQYTETYRPQYHFSANTGWIGDPDGLVRYNNKYHLFWWGHATSSDLVYWTEKSWPMQGDNSAFDYYSGSVVVDSKNTAGFKSGTYAPMVALFTNHNKTTGLEAPALSSSNDYLSDYTNFYLYNSGTPVMTTANGFRDPSVFWDATNNQWVMAIAANASNRTVQFYYSTNLKTWRILNSFGLLGLKENWWECPDLIQLPIDGNVNNKKWVLLLGTSAKTQYFLGDFDGLYGFDIDPTCDSYLRNGTGIQGTVFADFETTGYTGWTATGTAFGSGPASGNLSGQQSVFGYLGNKLVNSFNNGDGALGTLTSTSFTITKNCINFLIGGGNNAGQTCINLIVDGSVVQSTTGRNNEVLKWAGWNVSSWIGKTAQIKIVDNSTGSWGHINVDHIVFADALWNNNIEHALIADYGSDFYAARTYRDYDNVENRTVMMGWMGNWDYANSTPTSWGRGQESLPRELSLKTFADGVRLIQQPIPALKKLRNDSVIVTNKSVQNTQTLTEFTPAYNYYEIDAVFNVATGANFGLNLCVSGTNKVVLGYDATNSNLYLDRTKSGNVAFSSAFPNVVTAPLLLDNGQIKLHIYIDQSSIEVFANDGVRVISSLIYPDASSKLIQLFSTNGTTVVQSLKAYNLKSIWKTSPSAVPKVFDSGNKEISLYPNPVKSGQALTVNFLNPDFTGKDVKLKLFTLQGKLVSEENYPTVGSSVSHIKNILSSGVYIVTIESEGYTKVSKLVVQ
jgi:sucrose-6-phosphate hydrolase SacC (GH32 family)